MTWPQCGDVCFKQICASMQKSAVKDEPSMHLEVLLKIWESILEITLETV